MADTLYQKQYANPIDRVTKTVSGLIPKKDQFREARAACLAQGGEWDVARNVCRAKTPTPGAPIDNTPKPGDKPGEATIDEQSKKGAFVGKDGRTIIASKGEIRGLLENAQAKQMPQANAVGTAQNQAMAAQQAAAIQQQLAQNPQLTEQDLLNAVPQEQGLEALQAGGAGIAGGIAGGFAGSALAGGALGTAIAPGVGTVAGAVIGGIIGAIGAAYTKISLDKRSDVKQALKVGRIANTNFGQTIDALNAGLITKDVALRRFQEDRISLYSARENLKRETDTDLNRFLSGGADELATVNDYINDLELIYNNEFALAVSAPNPQNIKYVHQQGLSQDE